MKIRQAPTVRARVEMVPLIDSFFLILVYFIYAFLSMAVHRGVPLTLPKAATAIEEKQEHHGISVTQDGIIFLNKQKVSIDALKDQLRVLQAQAPDEGLFLYLYGDERAQHGLVVSVLDVLRELKIERVFIETRHES